MNDKFLLRVALLVTLSPLTLQSKAEVFQTHRKLEITDIKPLILLRTEESRVSARVNYYVDLEAKRASEKVTSQFLLKTVNELLEKARDLKNASADSAIQEFKNLDLDSHYLEFAADSVLLTQLSKTEPKRNEILSPLTADEVRSIESTVTRKLNEIANVYNKNLQKFVGVIKEYQEALANEPELREAVASEIRNGNYSPSYNGMLGDSVYSRLSLREFIIKTMTAQLITTYAGKVQIPSGDEHYDALLPELPSTAN